MERTKHELRCFCSRHPLLAMYGVDETGRLYIHCRVYKQNKVYGDWIAYGGKVKMLCRECLRWHMIVFKNDRAELTESPVPPEVDRRTRIVDETSEANHAIQGREVSQVSGVQALGCDKEEHRREARVSRH